MQHCLRLSLPAAAPNLHSSSPPVQGNSADDTPRSSVQTSPTVNLTREYTLAIQTNSYSEMWSKIHPNNSSVQEIDPEQLEGHEEPVLLTQVLHPNKECVQEALRYARPSILISLVSAYFDHSEDTSHLCCLLLRSIHQARSLYSPLHDLLEVLPLDSESNSLTEFQCDRAFDLFLQFDSLENPFPCPGSHNFLDMSSCFSQLKQQLDHRLCKSRSRVRLFRRARTGSAICLIGTAVGVAISAIAIATHALVALVAAAPFLPTFLPSKITKKELAHVAQLDAAANGIFVLHKYLDTIDCLVTRLHTTVEGDKLLIRIGLGRGKDKHAIREVVKLLRKNHPNIHHQLMDLEEHLCLCFNAINWARSLLLQEIHLHQTHCS